MYCPKVKKFLDKWAFVHQMQLPNFLSSKSSRKKGKHTRPIASSCRLLPKNSAQDDPSRRIPPILEQNPRRKKIPKRPKMPGNMTYWLVNRILLVAYSCHLFRIWKVLFQASFFRGYVNFWGNRILDKTGGHEIWHQPKLYALVFFRENSQNYPIDLDQVWFFPNKNASHLTWIRFFEFFGKGDPNRFSQRWWKMMIYHGKRWNITLKQIQVMWRHPQRMRFSWGRNSSTCFV